MERWRYRLCDLDPTWPTQYVHRYCARAGKWLRKKLGFVDFREKTVKISKIQILGF